MNKKKCIKWSEKEDAILIQAKKDGLSYKDILEKFGDKLHYRSADALKHRVENLRKEGLIPPFQEAKQIYPQEDLSCEKRFEKLLEENNKLLKEIAKQSHNNIVFMDGIRCDLINLTLLLEDIKKETSKKRLFKSFK